MYENHPGELVLGYCAGFKGPFSVTNRPRPQLKNSFNRKAIDSLVTLRKINVFERKPSLGAPKSLYFERKPKEHSTIDKVGGGKLTAWEKICFV